MCVQKLTMKVNSLHFQELKILSARVSAVFYCTAKIIYKLFIKYFGVGNETERTNICFFCKTIYQSNGHVNNSILFL